MQTLRTARGVVRSLGIYYGDRERAAAMDHLHRQFVQPGDLVFDIGAHVGDHIATFRRLGARVVAVEPQPALIATLKMIYGRSSDVMIASKAVGRQTGKLPMMINMKNPTVSSLSGAFVHAAHGAAGWRDQVWDRSIEVPVTTLDALIAEHGTPVFIKIDVEGSEAEVLAGLTQPVDALSFEFTTIQRDVARACVARCTALGFTRFNMALGDSHRLGPWRSADAIATALGALPHEANSGDVYATLE